MFTSNLLDDRTKRYYVARKASSTQTRLDDLTPHPICQLAMTCSCNEGEESIQDHRQTVNTLREQGREKVRKPKENHGKPMVLLMAEILHQLRLVDYPTIYRVGFLYISGSAGFLPSTVALRQPITKNLVFLNLTSNKKNSNQQSLVSCAREVELHTNK